MTNTPDYSSASIQFAFDVNSSPFFKKDEANFINIAGQKQLNSLASVSILDIYLSTNNVIEPHYHQSASELVYCISGAITISLLNPFTKQLLSYAITAGQIVNIPQAWWHFEIATEDNTHILAIFDAPNPDTILGSDLLRLTPAQVMAYTYCLDVQQWTDIISEIPDGLVLGPPSNCSR